MQLSDIFRDCCHHTVIGNIHSRHEANCDYKHQKYHQIALPVAQQVFPYPPVKRVSGSFSEMYGSFTHITAPLPFKLVGCDLLCVYIVVAYLSVTQLYDVICHKFYRLIVSNHDYRVAILRVYFLDKAEDLL